MARLVPLLIGMGLFQSGWLQQPTVLFNVQLNPQMRVERAGTSIRWYTDQGEHSTVSLRFYFESGYSLYLAQRLQRIPADADSDSMNEAYLEKVGGWRIGKFYTPFGTGWLLKESVAAVQTPTRFAIGALPMQVAYVFNGKDRQQGLLVRVGTQRGGASVAVGRHLGINATAFTPWRLPEEPLDREGYSQLYGADYRWDWNDSRFNLEWVLTYDSKTQPNAHYLGARWQATIGLLEPEAGLVYQTAERRWAWRAGVSAPLGRDFRFGSALRGRGTRLDAFFFTLYGRL